LIFVCKFSVTPFVRTFLANENKQVMTLMSFIDANMINDEYQGSWQSIGGRMASKTAGASSGCIYSDQWKSPLWPVVYDPPERSESHSKFTVPGINTKKNEHSS
jgi:hypothetical protein